MFSDEHAFIFIYRSITEILNCKVHFMYNFLLDLVEQIDSDI